MLPHAADVAPAAAAITVTAAAPIDAAPAADTTDAASHFFSVMWHI